MPISATSLGDEKPSGENLEYEKVFTDLNLAAQPEEERQAGNEIIPGQEPDPKQIVAHAEAVLSLSHDLRAAVLYGYAALRLQGFSGLAEATTYIRTCLTEFWDTCHPELDADDDDPTMRINAVLGLVDPATMLRAVRYAPLTESNAFGRLSLRDLAIAEGEIPAPADMDNPPTQQVVAAAFKDTPVDALTAILDSVRTALDDIAAINAVFDDRLPGQGPALEPLATLLKKAVAALAPAVGAEDDAVAAPDGGAGAPAPGAPAAAAAPGTINSDADVQRALERIIEYYERHEPSSPVPILLHRARRLIGADFMTIVRDLAPMGVDNVNLVGGMENPE